MERKGERMNTRNSRKTFPGFALRVIVAHTATYFIFGFIMSNVFDYGEVFRREVIRDYCFSRKFALP
jgi:hypothetical protein